MERMMMGNEQEPQPFTFVFDEVEPNLSTKDLSGYLYYFRSVYAIAFEFSQKMPVEYLLSKPEEFKERLKSHIASQHSSVLLETLQARDLGPFEPKIVRMKKESPLEIVIVGSIAALVAAAIISGGDVDLKVAKFKLNPIGDGLSKLRDLFRG